jgi:hypothetical protein
MISEPAKRGERCSVINHMFHLRSHILILTSTLILTPLVGCSSADAMDDSAAPEEVATESAALKSFPPLPSPKLAVPEGNQLAFFFDALGVQIYSCQATASGHAWTFVAPEASLFNPRGKLVVKHFGGPTWQSVADGSKVVATKVDEFTDDPASIPELLLIASSHEGKGVMADVTYIQRLETVGGIAPTSTCDAVNAGATARVPYSSTYYFYRKACD